MYFIRYRQPYISCQPPDWPRDREIAMGSEIARVGKAHFRKQFREGHWLPRGDTQPPVQQGPYSDGDRGFTIPVQPPKSKQSRLSTTVSIVFFVIIIGCGAVFCPNELGLALVSGVVLCIIIYVLYLASLALAVARHDRWLGRCLKRYKATESARITYRHVLSCGRCGQQLRLPSGRGRVRVHCPSCSNSFLYHT